MGGDSILAFDTWREPGRILSLSKLIVTTRDQIQVEDVIDKLEGTTCSFKPTSCPDQLAKALKNYLQGA